VNVKNKLTPLDFTYLLLSFALLLMLSSAWWAELTGH